MKIKVSELEQFVSSLFVELRLQKGEEIEIEREDFYWAIGKQDLYNPYVQPKQLTLGQLSDDIQHINKIATKKLPIVSSDFLKISSIFNFIGQKTAW